ncbi:uncharacterized protein LOC129717932 [Wyeomyia smithii]|uniref:uncharacterized protein LOC129717932 n=1 Tax=Wyeomyia smithii TaxID=174621 RepID=UPI002467BE32|nr:uncharacterized protein LOC129717932 [Wyeomyia smithii]XP_055524198.1 uncharacterized protein LOC129717932 [Wyeomyia smithii]
MPLKSDLIWDKLNQRLAQVDRSKRSFLAIIFIHLRQDGKIVRTVVLDCSALKIEEIESGSSFTATYPAERIDASIEIDDDDFYSVATKQTTFSSLMKQEKVKVQGNPECFLKLDEKFK